MQNQTVSVPKFPVVTKSLHAELKKRVNQYLEEHTIRGTGNYKLFTKAAILVSLFFITSERPKPSDNCRIIIGTLLNAS